MALGVDNWLEAQNGVLGSIMISPELTPRILSQMSDADFSGPNRQVFQAIRLLFNTGQTVDPITVCDKLGKDYTKFIMDLMAITPTAANYQAYIDVAKRQSRTARLREIGQLMADEEDPERVQDLLSQAVAVNSERQTLKAVTFQQASTDFFERHSAERKVDYIRWPIVELNDQLFLDKGDFVIIGGKPSAGKTAFALQAAWEQSAHKRVGFFSLETKIDKLIDRQFATAGIPLENIKRNCLNESHWSKATEFAAQAEHSRRFEMICESGLTVADIQAFSAARGYDVIYIDYIQLLRSSGATRYEQVTNLSLDLHRFSQTAGCAVVGLSQLSRPGNMGGKKADPDMASLRESGQLEQDADAVLLLYLEDDRLPNGRRILKCAKNKEGERFRIMLDFDGRTQRFSKSKSYGDIDKEISQTKRELNAQEKVEQSRQLTILPTDTKIPFDA